MPRLYSNWYSRACPSLLEPGVVVKVRFAPVVPVAGVAYKAVVRGVRHSEWKLAPQIGLQRELGVSDSAEGE